MSVILAEPIPNDDARGHVALHPKWQKDGSRALVSISRGEVPNTHENNFCELVSLPVKSDLPVRVYNLGSVEECMLGLPEIGGKVYFGGNSLYWIDLATGEVDSEDFQDVKLSKDELAIQLFEQNGSLYYKRHLKRAVGAPSGQPQAEEGVEIGRLQLKDASLKPSITLWQEDLSAVGDSDDLSYVSYISFAPSGTDGVFSVPQGNVEKIAFVKENSGIVRVFDPGLDLKSYSLGSLVWSQDGKTLYAPVLTWGDAENTLNSDLAEIPVAGGQARLTKIAVIHDHLDSEMRDYLRSTMQVSLSPDGRWIAASPAALGKGTLDDHDRALFLIDLHDPARHMERVPIPPQPAEGTAASSAKTEATK
jgi:hypothetical protein